MFDPSKDKMKGGANSRDGSSNRNNAHYLDGYTGPKLKRYTPFEPAKITNDNDIFSKHPQRIGSAANAHLQGNNYE